MKNLYVVSILRPIVEQIEIRKKSNESLLELKKYIVDEVQKHTKMNSTDMQAIIRDVTSSPTTMSLTRYLWNSLLKFEGLGAIK